MKKSVHKSKRPAQSKVNYFVKRFVVSFVSVSAIVAIFLNVSNTISSKSCANSISCIKDLSVKIENDATGIFAGQKVIPPKMDLSSGTSKIKVLGLETPAGPKHIYVDLTTQTLTAYQGDMLVMKTPISSGLWGKTPTGDFTIWITLKSTRMAGGSGADYYNLPNVPYVMFFSNSEVAKERGFSLHGAYWHNNFGYPMSHGCVNMRQVDAEALYNWVDPQPTGGITYATKDNPGTVITIFGKPI